MSNDSLYDVFGTELDSGERLLWTGRPKQGLMLRPTDAVMIPYSLMWGGFVAIFLITSPWSASRPNFFNCFLVPMAFMAFYMLVGRFIVDALQRSQTYYALSDKRVIILSKFFNLSVKSLRLGSIPEITLGGINGGGQGTIRFGPDQGITEAFEMMGWRRNRTVVPSLEMIDDARSVYDQIRAAQDAGQPDTKKA